MKETARLSRRESDSSTYALDCEGIARRTGSGACQTVLRNICTREQAGKHTTVWDLQKVTGLPLHEAFAALRTLEFGRLVRIADNPSDPFGALVSLRSEGIERLAQRKVA